MTDKGVQKGSVPPYCAASRNVFAEVPHRRKRGTPIATKPGDGDPSYVLLHGGSILCGPPPSPILLRALFAVNPLSLTLSLSLSISASAALAISLRSTLVPSPFHPFQRFSSRTHLRPPSYRFSHPFRLLLSPPAGLPLLLFHLFV